MASPTPTPENPNAADLKKAYHIGGLKVEFPYRPYGSQLAFMGRVISTLDRAQRDGHCHALLESPTGTGKSLSLLCSTLAWQQSFAAKARSAPPNSKPDPRALSDPLDHGGGFVPEDDDAPGTVTSETTQPAAEKSNKKKKSPKIYYASRTHSQISQVIREYQKTTYRVPMAVLGSKKHYCTNPNVRGKDNVDEQCKQLLSTRNPQCPEFKNHLGVKSHPSLKKGGCHEAHDIEDLVKVGQVVKGCSYYAARSMASEALLVFCPYNYIVNPVIRGAMDLDIKGSILVLDEAHNMEDIARSAGSVDVEEQTILSLKNELEGLCEVDEMYAVLYELTQDLLSWIDRRRNMLAKRDFQLYASCWTGDKAIRELEEANISRSSFPSLLCCVTEAIKAATDTEREEEPHLTGMAVMTLEGLFSSLTYFFSRNGSHLSDYQLALRKHVKREAGNSDGDWTFTFSLWCLNPAVVFKDIAEISLSVILTSGTLSPMDSFTSELGVQFATNLEAPHVIDIESQVWPAIISRGPNNFPLNASYKTSQAYDFQDALGKSLEGIFRIVPGGCLVFFPSYKLMEKLRKRWCETGQWSQLNANKSLFLEPRGGNQDDFESVLNSYYDAIRGTHKPLLGRKKRAKKSDVSNQCDDKILPQEGAALFAVCRGKVSEGIDFSDDNARVVIIVGIPFPNINDIQVDLKRKYNDVFKSSKNLLSGSEWYCQQAFRALNQAAGRCIRHKSDYGAIIFLDERYQEARNRVHVSKWLRNSIRQYDSVDSSLEDLKTFFSNVKARLGKNNVNALESSNSKLDNLPSTNRSKASSARNQDTKLMSDDSRHLSLEHCNASVSSYKPRGDFEQVEKDAMKSPDFVSICSRLKDSSYPLALSLEEPDVSIVTATGSPWSFPKDEASSGILNSVTNGHSSSSRFQSLNEVTPQKNSVITETSHYQSANSCCQKRRLPAYSRECDANDSHCTSTENSALYGRRIDFESKSTSSVIPKRFYICCLLCNNALSLPENHSNTTCYSTTTSKTYLESLKPRHSCTSKVISILVIDTSLVHQKLSNPTLEGEDSNRGVWCEKDGCVYNIMFCPFCSIRDNCLGVQVMATDSSNLHLLNKVLFFSDQVEIKNPEASIDPPKNEAQWPFSTTNKDELNCTGSFSYTAQEPSTGWITTKSKVRNQTIQRF